MMLGEEKYDFESEIPKKITIYPMENWKTKKGAIDIEVYAENNNKWCAPGQHYSKSAWSEL